MVRSVKVISYNVLKMWVKYPHRIVLIAEHVIINALDTVCFQSNNFPHIIYYSDKSLKKEFLFKPSFLMSFMVEIA